jgi:hypothetical protein
MGDDDLQFSVGDVDDDGDDVRGGLGFGAGGGGGGGMAGGAGGEDGTELVVVKRDGGNAMNSNGEFGEFSEAAGDEALVKKKRVIQIEL